MHQPLVPAPRARRNGRRGADGDDFDASLVKDSDSQCDSKDSDSPEPDDENDGEDVDVVLKCLDFVRELFDFVSKMFGFCRRRELRREQNDGV